MLTEESNMEHLLFVDLEWFWFTLANTRDCKVISAHTVNEAH